MEDSAEPQISVQPLPHVSQLHPWLHSSDYSVDLNGSRLSRFSPLWDGGRSSSSRSRRSRPQWNQRVHRNRIIPRAGPEDVHDVSIALLI